MIKDRGSRGMCRRERGDDNRIRRGEEERERAERGRLFVLGRNCGGVNSARRIPQDLTFYPSPGAIARVNSTGVIVHPLASQMSYNHRTPVHP